MSSNNDNSGCFWFIAIVAVGLGILLLMMQGLKAVGKEWKNDPGSVIGGIFVFAFFAWLIGYLVKKR